jgi:hypothetical protein
MLIYESFGRDLDVAVNTILRDIASLSPQERRTTLNELLLEIGLMVNEITDMISELKEEREFAIELLNRMNVYRSED